MSWHCWMMVQSVSVWWWTRWTHRLLWCCHVYRTTCGACWRGWTHWRLGPWRRWGRCYFGTPDLLYITVPLSSAFWLVRGCWLRWFAVSWEHDKLRFCLSLIILKDINKNYVLCVAKMSFPVEDVTIRIVLNETEVINKETAISAGEKEKSWLNYVMFFSMWCSQVERLALRCEPHTAPANKVSASKGRKISACLLHWKMYIFNINLFLLRLI